MKFKNSKKNPDSNKNPLFLLIEYEEVLFRRKKNKKTFYTYHKTNV